MTHTSLVLVAVALGHGVYRKLTLIGGQRAEKLEKHWFSLKSCVPLFVPLQSHIQRNSEASRDVEAAISSTASASTPIASASNRTWTLTEPGLYLIYELADKRDYQNQQLTIYKGTLLVKMIA